MMYIRIFMTFLVGRSCREVRLVKLPKNQIFARQFRVGLFLFSSSCQRLFLKDSQFKVLFASVLEERESWGKREARSRWSHVDIVVVWTWGKGVLMSFWRREEVYRVE